MNKVAIRLLIIIFLGMISMPIVADNLSLQRQQAIKTYMNLLNSGQYANMINLFVADGVVDSPPVKGNIPSSTKMSATQFYQMAASEKFFIKVKVNDIFVSIDNPNKFAVHLTYEVVGENPPTPRSAIDIFEFQPESTKIKLLTAVVNK